MTQKIGDTAPLKCGFVSFLFSVIKQSSPRLNNVIVIGCVMAYCCVFMYGAESFVESCGVHTVVCKVCSLISN